MSVPRVLLVLAAPLVVVTPSVALGQAGWYLTPSLSVAESFDDNIFQSRSNREHDFITSITPGLRLAYQSEPLNLSLGYSTTYAKFVEHPELDNLGNTQHGAFDVNYIPSPAAPWTLSLNASYVSTENRNELDPAVEEEGRRVTTVASVQGSGTYKFTAATSVVGRASYSRAEVEGFATSETYGSGLSLRHQFTQNDTGSLNYSFNLFQSDTTDTRISNVLTVGYDRQIYEDLKAGVRVGIRVTDGRVTPEIGADLDGAIRPIQGLSLSAGYSDTVRVVLGERDPVEVRTLALTATYAPPWIQYLTLTLSPGVSYVTKLGGGDERVVFHTVATATYSYPITSWLSAQISYNFSYRQNGDAVVRNLVSVGLSASYPVRIY